VSAADAGRSVRAALVLTAGLLAAGMIVLAATRLFVRHPQMSEIERP